MQKGALGKWHMFRMDTQKWALGKWQIFRMVLQVLMIFSVLILTIMFVYSPKVCVEMIGVGNAFFILWLIFGDPIKSRIRIRISERNFVEFILCAVIIWFFAYMFSLNGLCGTLTDMMQVFRNMLHVG